MDGSRGKNASSRSSLKARCGRAPLREQPFDVCEQLLGLVPAVEDAETTRAAAARVGGDDDRYLGTSRASAVRDSESLRDVACAVDDDDVFSLLESIRR